MADQPILFNGPMVRATLEGHKTQTRRLLSNSNLLFNGAGWPKGLNFSNMRLDKAWVDGGPSPAGNPGPYLKADWPYGKLIDGHDGADGEWLMARLYPKMQPGDRLWVKETWAHSGQGVWSVGAARSVGSHGVFYRADDDRPGAKYFTPLFLPREFSRLTLTVTDVRVERLQDISRGDAMEEGCPFPNMQKGPNPVDWFRDLWGSINGKREGASWDDNPWVAAYTFTVEQRNIDR